MLPPLHSPKPPCAAGTSSDLQTGQWTTRPDCRDACCHASMQRLQKSCPQLPAAGSSQRQNEFRRGRAHAKQHAVKVCQEGSVAAAAGAGGGGPRVPFLPACTSPRPSPAAGQLTYDGVQQQLVTDGAAKVAGLHVMALCFHGMMLPRGGAAVLIGVARHASPACRGQLGLWHDLRALSEAGKKRAVV